MTKQTKDIAGAVFPTPVVLATTIDDQGLPNIITLAWAGVVCSNPFMVGVAIRPTRYSHALLESNPELVINVPDRTLLAKTDFCGVVSGKQVRKFEASGLTAIPSTMVKPPMISECPINLECRVSKTVPLGAHNLFLSEVVQTHVDDTLIVGGQADLSKLSSFVYLGLDYFSLGEKIGHHGFTKGRL